jgi:asparagine synthase (glutamine-hydrolysing)
MCGIAGAVDLNGNRTFAPERLSAMLRAIAHRGPDDQFSHEEPGIVLGARRLSIVDLAGGRQPLANEDGTVWVAFNGELFDYPELRRDLLARGHRFATHCDTEAWVHLYEDHGLEMLAQARGQYAVSLWDSSRRRLVLARDRAGNCPLYYTQVDGWLLWASEVKGLLASGLVQARPDPKAIDHFFTFFGEGLERSFFEGIHSLAPGQRLTAHAGRVEVVRYWELEFPDAGEERKERDSKVLVDEFDHLMRQAIRRRLRGDVPVVSYLSGGVDSTTVLMLASQESGRAVPSFTVGLDRAGTDESGQAHESAGLLGSPLTVVTMGKKEMASGYPELIRAAEAPVMDTTSACMIRLAQAVHAGGVKVAITGEGADEALAGYAWTKAYPLRPKWAVWSEPFDRGLRKLMLNRVGVGTSHAHPYAATAGLRVPQQTVYDLLAASRETLYSADMWKRLVGYSAYDDLPLAAERMKRWSPLNQSLYISYKTMLTGHLLKAKGDRAAMNASVETRTPFLDEDVIAFCSKLAPKYKLRGFQEKWLLRKVAERGLPRHIAWRRKHGFRGAMSATFLGADRPEWVDELLSSESLQATGFFDPQAIERHRAELIGRDPKWRSPVARKIRNTTFDLGMTCVVATQLWHHTFCGGGLCSLPTWTPPPLSER